MHHDADRCGFHTGPEKSSYWRITVYKINTPIRKDFVNNRCFLVGRIQNTIHLIVLGDVERDGRDD